ncbi:MAG: DegT/DnrJ/EryC1/StrS family aminotransferase [Pirellulales bacterium]|nr:DegT/DnrJ/EryC1/StrS family aminotransferase [Pirellulales bacterium]
MNRLALLGGEKAVREPFPEWPIWDRSDRQAVVDVLESGKWWMYAYGEAELGSEADGAGPRSQVEQFEEELAAFHHVKHAIAVTNGSTALDICMRAIDLAAGDEVITTPYTFFATSQCILNADALPVYVDIDPETYNIDVTKIEEAITPRTRAIMPVHFSGELADVEAIGRIADRHGLRFIEDAAQSQGVSLRGDRFVGSFGDAAIFSFQASKCLTCGEGGAIITDSDEFAEAAWSLRHYGRVKNGLWYEHHRLAANSRMTEFQGALLRTQLRRLGEQNSRRMENVDYFYKKMEEVEGLTPVNLHPDAKTHSHYLVMLRYDASRWGGLSRDIFLEALNAEGVPAFAGYSFLNFQNPVFYRLDLTSAQSPYMAGRQKPIDYRDFLEKCPNADRACREEAVWLMHQLFLGNISHVDAIIRAIVKIKEQQAELHTSRVGQ